jgi:hypothetical protein
LPPKVAFIVGLYLPAAEGLGSFSVKMLSSVSTMTLCRRKLGENGRGALSAVELGQNHLTVHRDVSMDRPHSCVHLKHVMVKPGMLVENQINQHLWALTPWDSHLAYLGSIIGKAFCLVKRESRTEDPTELRPQDERVQLWPDRNRLLGVSAFGAALAGRR